MFLRPSDMCYRGSTAKKRPVRSGQTDKVSVSIDRSDLAALRKRARRLYAGNLSAVIAEGVRRVREEEGREALTAWLGDVGDATPEERETIRTEWRGASSPPRRRGRRAA
jgi:hypothetical protein